MQENARGKHSDYPESASRQDFLEGLGVKPEFYEKLEELYPNLSDLIVAFTNAAGTNLNSASIGIGKRQTWLATAFGHADPLGRNINAGTGFSFFKEGEACALGQFLRKQPGLKIYAKLGVPLEQFHTADAPNLNTIRRRFLQAAGLEESQAYLGRKLDCIMRAAILTASESGPIDYTSILPASEKGSGDTHRDLTDCINNPTLEFAEQLGALLREPLAEQQKKAGTPTPIIPKHAILASTNKVLRS